MPDVMVRNETQERLNIAFRFVAPAFWRNSLPPGDTWIAQLPSTPFTIEVRLDLGNNQFLAHNALAGAADIAGGWVAGAAGIVGGFLGGREVAAPLMRHAIEAGGRFAQNAEGMIITVSGVWIPFRNKTYAVRFDEDSGYSLWDVDENHKM